MSESELHGFTPIGFHSDDGVAFVEPCQVVDVDGQPVRVHGDLRTEAEQAMFAAVVRSARRLVDTLNEPRFQPVLAWAARWTRNHPQPLAIDGHAYHRRTRNRKGRRR